MTTPLWFLNSLVQIHVSCTEGSDGLSAIEHCVPCGDSPPLHCHRTEDELFHILEGEFRFQLAGTEQRAGPGTVLLAPKGITHTYRAESAAGGRFITVTRGGDFERFVRQMSRPASGKVLPPHAGPPPPEAIAALTEAAAAHGIIIQGPPLTAR